MSRTPPLIDVPTPTTWLPSTSLNWSPMPPLTKVPNEPDVPTPADEPMPTSLRPLSISSSVNVAAGVSASVGCARRRATVLSGRGAGGRNAASVDASGPVGGGAGASVVSMNSIS